MAHQRISTIHPNITLIHTALEQSNYSPQTDADVTSKFVECVHCANRRVRLGMRMSVLKLFWTYRLPRSVASHILGILPESQHNLLYFILIADRFAKLFWVVRLKRIRSMNFTGTFLNHLVKRYGLQRTLLSDNINQFSSKTFQSLCQVLERTNVFSTT